MNRVRIGLIFCKKGQSSPFEMFQNKKVESNAFDLFNQIMCVPSSFDPKNFMKWNEREFTWYPACSMKQDAIRQYIGNTNVLVFFIDGTEPFDGSKLDELGQMCHCFIVVHAFPAQKFRLTVIHRRDLNRPFGPHIPPNYLFDGTPALKDFLLTKVYNAQMSIVKCPPTNVMYKTPRQATLKDIAIKFAPKLVREEAK